MKQRDLLIKTAQKLGMFRPRDVKVPRALIGRMVRDGILEQDARGLYRLADYEFSEHHSIVQVVTRVPHAIICLCSALKFHEIGTENPPAIWVMMDLRARRPSIDYPPIEVVRASGPALRSGVERHVIEGRVVQVYCLEKTIADCFKYRNKIGIDVAIGAAKDAWTSRRLNMDTLWRYGRICRVTNVMRPYMEAIVT